MRTGLICAGLLMALTVHAVTPDVGKEKLRRLVKLPSISFAAEWTFDPERGFSLGSGIVDTRVRLIELRRQLKQDLADAEIYLSLGEVYTSLADIRNARLSWQRAVDLYRKRLDLQPDNGALLAGLGRALQGAGRDDEAESVLRRAIALAPGEWKCRVALGRFLDAQARRGILERPAPVPAPGAGNSIEPVPDRPSAAEVALAQKQIQEAGECFEQAVAAAPGEGEVYFRRGMHRCLRQVMLNQMRFVADIDGDSTDAFEGCFTPEILADLQRASRLSPKDFRLIGGTALFEIYTVTAQKTQFQNVSWDSLPEKSQLSLRESIARLENLAQDAETGEAAGALEVLGILQGPVLHEPNRCITNLRRALALEPARDQAWDVLLATLANAGRHEELLDVCEDQVKQRESARTRVLLAKAFEKLKQWDNSEEQVRLAALQDPNDFSANLSVGALLLKRSGGDSAVLAEASLWLARSETALSKLPRPRRTRQQLIDLTLTRGIYYALNGDLDTARQWVKAVVDREQDNGFAKEILSAMDF